MQFSVPQFIESESKIAGPLTFRQVLYLTGGGIVVMVSYFSLAETNPTVFAIITFFAILFATAFAFVKIGGFSLNVFLKNFVAFIVSSKIYLWKQRVIAPKIIPRHAIEQKGAEKTPGLKFKNRSRLNELSVQIETATR